MPYAIRGLVCALENCQALLLVIKPGNRPHRNTALTLLSDHSLPSNAFFRCYLSSHYQVTSTPQAYGVHVIVFNIKFLIGLM
jgi:hypothetical protein